MGIGAAISNALATERFAVVVADINLDAATAEVASADAARGRTSARQLDVADASSIEAAFAEVERVHGRCDVLVKNAGIAGVASLLEC